MRKLIQIPQETIAASVTLWRTTFWEAWEPLPLDQKLAWLFLVSKTFAILTILEFLLLH
ncbi:MAG: hypothetical protein Q8L37_05255 [Candidatus Gottesmanbacteria bacterium]|nr:hypothetical protein [Candidatus Gottesmanbacteria bacterium]